MSNPFEAFLLPVLLGPLMVGIFFALPPFLVLVFIVRVENSSISSSSYKNR